MKRIAILIPAVAALLCALLITGCKTNNAGNAILALHIHTYLDSNEIVFGTSYPNPAGRNITVNRAEFYISNIVLTGTDGSLTAVSGTVLVAPPAEDYIVGSIPVGNYKSITFNVGIPVTNNHDDPSAHGGGDPLSSQTPSMHFASNTDGYIFMAFEGLVDSSVSGTGTPSKPFSYHIGTDSLLRPVVMPDHSVAPYNTPFSANAGKATYIHIIADYARLVRGVDMNANNITNTTDVKPLADTLANHIPGMFRYEE
jgi:hypothetical protein